MCTYDSSAWLGLPTAFRSSSEFTRESNTTLDVIQNLVSSAICLRFCCGMFGAEIECDGARTRC